jgi:translation elongation factor EF-1alpha
MKEKEHINLVTIGHVDSGMLLPLLFDERVVGYYTC